MIQIKKVFCLLELKWGMHVNVVYYLSLIVSILHIVACVLLIVSIFEPKKELVILYLITGIIRVIVLIVGIIWLICYGLVLTVYFWLCVYSWFKKLGGSTPVD
ncbi:GL10510 [Drosophila persimilis]|uniref:GL10510 n=1 Tax=Drosophila persimilis TaxID=7234 RepID=B4GBN1_DROPE|nr:GL10510 [Drosophila persimilis]